GTRPEPLPPPRRRTPPPPPPPRRPVTLPPVPSASTSGSHPSISQTAPIPFGVITSLNGGGPGDSGISYSSAARVQPPGAPYNINWHVHREEEERTALNYL